MEYRQTKHIFFANFLFKLLLQSVQEKKYFCAKPLYKCKEKDYQYTIIKNFTILILLLYHGSCLSIPKNKTKIPK